MNWQKTLTNGWRPQVEGMPLTDVLLVNIKLLTLPELKLITDQGAEGRKKLSEAFTGSSRLVSSMRRKSQIEAF